MLAAALVVASGCLHRSPDPTDVADHALITRQQLDENHFLTVYDAVEALHQNWLQTRGVDSFSTPSQVQVYLDNTRLGGVDQLHNIATTTVTWIRHFDGIAATGRWGLDHGAGVIYVSTHPEKADP